MKRKNVMDKLLQPPRHGEVQVIGKDYHVFIFRNTSNIENIILHTANAQYKIHRFNTLFKT